MKRNKILSIFLGLILILGAGLRLYKLGSIPVRPPDDEIRIAASAYFLGETKKDVAGRTLPLSIHLDGFAQNPVPIYMTLPLVKLLGPDMVSARLLPAIMGITGLYLVYQ